MAYNPGIEQDDEQQAQGQDQNGAGTNQLGGASGVITGQTSGQAQKQKGSGFVNIGQYLGANQADLAGQTDKAISKVNEGWGSANKNLASSQQQFNTTADQNRATLGDASTTDDDEQFAKTFLNDSQLGENDQQQFASWQNMDYKGPTAIQDTWSADQKKSDDLASTLSNPNGYFPAMEQIFGEGRSDYGSGMQRLDSSLMAADKTGRERIDQNTTAQQSALKSSIDSATQAAQQKVAQYQDEAQSGRDAAWTALNSYMPTYATGLADRVVQTNAQRQAEYNAATQGGGQRINGTTANTQYHDPLESERQITGTTNTGAYIYDNAGYVHPEQLSYSYVDPTRAGYTTYGGDVGLGSLSEGDLAKMEALFSLSGDEAARQSIESDLAEKIGFSDIYRNGATSPAYSFDQAGYDRDRQNAIDAAIQKSIAEEIAREDQARRDAEEFLASTRRGTRADITPSGQLVI